MPPRPARRLAGTSAARWAGRRWLSYLALVGVIAAGVTAFAIFPTIPLGHGLVVLVLGAVAIMIVLSVVGIGTPVRDGRLGGQWSLDGLRRLRGWHVIDDVPFERGDVDHVVVAPSAVLAIEAIHRPRTRPGSKAEAEQHQRDLHAAERAAQQVRQFLADEQLGDPPVVAVLMIWGPGAPNLPAGHRTEGDVRVVDGTSLGRWTHVFRTQHLDEVTRCDLYVHLEKFARRATDTAPVPVRTQIWHEFRGGVAQERAQRHGPSTQRRHGLHLVPAPGTAAVPVVLPIAMGATQAAG